MYNNKRFIRQEKYWELSRKNITVVFFPHTHNTSDTADHQTCGSFFHTTSLQHQLSVLQFISGLTLCTCT